MKDLFEAIIENPEHFPKRLLLLVDEMEEEFLDYGLDYQELQKFQVRFRSIGYTFSFGLDAEPYDLRKLNLKNLISQWKRRKLVNNTFK